jgi:hypothetical protein
MAKPDSQNITRFPGDRPAAGAVTAHPSAAPAPPPEQPPPSASGTGLGFQVALLVLIVAFLLLFAQVVLDLLLGLFHG